ncbi:MAG: O-antigen ligase family protein [Patescibacteria group bacterium]
MQRQTAIKTLRTIVLIGIYGGLLMPVYFPVLFLPDVIFPFVFSKLIFFQILIGLTVPAYIILAWIEPKYRPRWSFLYIAFIAYYIALFLSVIFAVDPIRSWWGNQERMNGLFTMLHFLVWLTMATSLIKTWKEWKRLLNYQIFLGVFMACIALLQKPFPKLLSFPAGDRVGGLLDNPIYQGAYQLFILFFIALLFLKTKSNGWRTWYVLAGITSLTAMFAAGSRGPFMGLIFGTVLSAVTVGILHHSKKIRIAVIGAVLACSLGYVGMVTFGTKTQAFASFSKAWPTAARMFMLQTGTAGRFIAWQISWEGFLERPLTGWGLDNYHLLFNKKYNPNSLRSGFYETWFDRSHNTVMDVVSMTGLIGFLTFAGIWVGIYYTVIRARRKKYIDIPTTAILIGLPAGYFLQNLFVFDHPAAFSMSYLLYALVICAGFPVFSGHKDNEVEAEKPSPTNPVPWVTFGVLQTVFLIIVYLTSVKPAYASVLSIKFNNAAASGNAVLLMDYAKRASAIQTPYLDEQTFLYSRSLIQIADRDQLKNWPQWRDFFALIQDVHQRYFASHPDNAHSIFIYANMLEHVGFAAKDEEISKMSEEQYLKAIELSPKRQQLYFTYARLLTSLGRVDEALEQLQKAVSFDEEIGESWWNLAMTTWMNKGDRQKGAEYIAKSQSVSFPRGVNTVQEAVLIAQSYDILNDKESLQKLVMMLPNLPAAPSGVYLEIAKACEHQELIGARDMIISALIKMDPKVKSSLAPLLNGQVQTIDEALLLTAPTTTPAAQPAVSDIPAPSATATGKVMVPYSGPRKQ